METESSIKFYKQTHFINRLIERFGVAITKEECEQLIENIEDYKPYPLRIEESGRSFHRVSIQGCDIVVLYDWEYKTLLTCYHCSWLIRVDGKWELKKRFKSKHIRRKNQIHNDLKKKFFPIIE